MAFHLFNKKAIDADLLIGESGVEATIRAEFDAMNTVEGVGHGLDSNVAFGNDDSVTVEAPIFNMKFKNFILLLASYLTPTFFRISNLFSELENGTTEENAANKAIARSHLALYGTEVVDNKILVAKANAIRTSGDYTDETIAYNLYISQVTLENGTPVIDSKIATAKANAIGMAAISAETEIKSNNLGYQIADIDGNDVINPKIKAVRHMYNYDTTQMNNAGGPDDAHAVVLDISSNVSKEDIDIFLGISTGSNDYTAYYRLPSVSTTQDGKKIKIHNSKTSTRVLSIGLFNVQTSISQANAGLTADCMVEFMCVQNSHWLITNGRMDLTGH